MGNAIHRPPHSKFEIEELIAIGQFDEAQAACDKNVEFYEDRAQFFRVLYLSAQAAKMGVKAIADDVEGKL